MADITFPLAQRLDELVLHRGDEIAEPHDAGSTRTEVNRAEAVTWSAVGEKVGRKERNGTHRRPPVRARLEDARAVRFDPTALERQRDGALLLRLRAEQQPCGAGIGWLDEQARSLSSQSF